MKDVIFKKGDCVICINNSLQWNNLTVGRKYIINNFTSRDTHIYIHNDNGELWGYAVHRFVSVMEYERNKVIENILE